MVAPGIDNTISFSSRSTIVKYRDAHGITLREEDRLCRPLCFGQKRKNRRTAINTREQSTIETAKQLRNKGLSFEKIAAVMNTMKLRTKSGKAQWYAKTVRDIVLR